METKRKETKVIYVGCVSVGGKSPVSIQSMTKTDTRDVRATVKQINNLEKAGCEIIRVSIPDDESADALRKIVKEINIPLIADIHFRADLAIKSIENGANGIRINPGNIGGKKKLFDVVRAAKEKNIVIRIGVNSGSLDKKWLEKYKGVTTEALAASALEYIEIIEDMGFDQIKVSLKAPDIRRTLDGYRLMSKKTRYPLHIGVTEAGLLLQSSVKSSIALGTLLMEGIGDTMRVSVTGDPVNEVIIAKEILQSLGLRNFGPEIISCPTCARCKVDLVKIVENFEKKLSAIRYPLSAKVALMGCIVNGPGEAKEADIGVAFGQKEAMLFKKGKAVRKVNEKDVVDILIREIVES